MSLIGATLWGIRHMRNPFKVWRRLWQTPETPYAQYRSGDPGTPHTTLDEEALAYHRAEPPGKVSIETTKRLETQYELALAYSPGVAAPCREIAKDPSTASLYTARSNLVAVVSNGTAVLGLGDIGPLAAKPVMEGKAALFKKFGAIDAIDLEINETDPEKLAEIIIALEPSIGGVNLEDIKAPECFIVEELCRKRMNIPVFHDDQHGTAVCTLAAMENALLLTGKKLQNVKLVCSGAGASAIACLNLLFEAGLNRKNVIVVDSTGVIHKGRKKGMSPQKEAVAVKTSARTLEDAMDDADVFLGLSTAGLLSPEWVKKMTAKPIIFALANPDPEIWPDHARTAAPDAIIATGRSDFPNQVNNVLCFPYIFRGAFDSGATSFTPAMLKAAADAIAATARMEPTRELEALYRDEDLTFGPNSIMPRVFDPRLPQIVPKAVADAV